MNHIHAKPTVRIFAAMLVSVTVIGLSSLAMHASTQNQNPLAPSLKSIQTDKATLFYVDQKLERCYFVERVVSGTRESKAVTEHLKLVAATL